MINAKVVECGDQSPPWSQVIQCFLNAVNVSVIVDKMNTHAGS